jgi:hypothetical protein
MRVLVACEESQAVCIAFRERGYEAYSCDLQECSGGHPEWHIQDDVTFHLNEGWDLMIAHPPCTFLSRIGQAHKARGKEVAEYRESEAAKAIDFIKVLWAAPIPKICIENPVGLANTRWRRPSQIIHPYYFGDNEMKETCLWLKGLPRLNGLSHIDKVLDKPKPTGSRIGKDGKVKNVYFCSRMDNKSGAAKLKSKTFPGIARAMAEQWGSVQNKFDDTLVIDPTETLL